MNLVSYERGKAVGLSRTAKSADTISLAMTPVKY